MFFEVPLSFLENDRIIEDDIPDILKTSNSKQLLHAIKMFHPDKVVMNDTNIKKCYYLNAILSHKRHLEHINKRYTDANERNRDLKNRLQKADCLMQQILSQGLTQKCIETEDFNVLSVSLSPISSINIGHLKKNIKIRRPRGRPRKNYYWDDYLGYIKKKL